MPLFAIAVTSLLLQGRSLADVAVGSTQTPQAAAQIGSQGVLDDKRLFFTIAERDAVDKPTGTRDESGLQNNQRTNSFEESIVQAPSIKKNKPALPSVQIHEIYYQARITSRELIRIIVNGSPCMSVHHEKRVQTSTIEVKCHALSASNLRLTLLTDGLRLQVNDGARSLGILYPGESL